ncbi:hypothetical protein K458DRAFT_60637 [Lentithecium fluviatile CBS 122367]|uniref:Zn(2)-C6 fungal-type domain-containing protein n=1 Tax=Lentithecium fluviatile CBS 122367 TaxID=1168545 RepID=A0A6G1JJB6_9PLEO|nr:hypothetical protein K458DRAFT_60637 [Lentithecium fluviatile CBS 122367]
MTEFDSESSSSIHHPNSHQTKPPRLRAACNQCNAAKVKCSGERSGCGRCQSLRVDCIYVESRVGKVQGVRLKRKKPEPETVTVGETTRSRSNSTQAAEDERTDEPETNGSTVPDVPSPKPQLQGSRDQLLPGWSPRQWSWDDSLLPFDAPGSIFHHEDGTMGMGNGEPSSTTSASACESRLSSIDFSSLGTADLPPQPSNPLLSASSFSSLNRTPSLRSTEPVSNERPRAKAKIDSKCVLALANILINLENYLLSDLRVLDLILNTVRSVTEEIRNIVHYQQKSRCDRCMFLFITIMHQVVILLEAGASVVFEAEAVEHDREGMLDGATNLIPMGRFGFGAFSSFNAEEQLSWKIHRIRKECQNSGELLAQIVALAKLGPRDTPLATPEQVEERIKCFTGLQSRIKALSDKACLHL